MKPNVTEPLRGEAARQAQLQAITKRNDAARAAGIQRRAIKDATAVDEAAQLDRREMRSLRDHP